MNPHEDQRLRDLLDDAVSDVEPRHGLDAITSRTKVSSMSTRPWLYGVTGAVVATAATIAAFAVLGDDARPTSAPDPAGSPSSAVSEEPSDDAPTDEPASEEPAPAQATVPVYYAGQTGQGPRLFREFHKVSAGGDDAAAAEAVREALSVDPRDPDYRTLWPSGSEVQHVEIAADTIVVDLADAGALRTRPDGMSEREAQIAVEQLIYTVQGVYQDRAPVRFLLDGQITDQVLGVPTSEPVSQGDEMATLAQVWIIHPQDGATVKSGSEVEGIGAFFEANVVWELKQGDTVVKSGFTTAEQCCTMAPYSFALPDVPAGDYLLVVKDQDMSDGEGFEPFFDTKRLTIG